MYRSRVFDALGWPFRVASTDEHLVGYVEQLYRGLLDGATGAVHEYVVADVHEDGSPPVRLTLAGETVGDGYDAGTLVPLLVHDVNRRALDDTPLLAAHAGGVTRGDAAVVLPAHMESGKTTLTGGLVRAGFSYLTDEAVAFDWDTLAVVPYAKPLSFDRGSWPLFAELEPVAPLPGDGYKRTQWQVPADAIRPGAFACGGLVRELVFPRYEPSAATELVAMTRGEALVELARNTFRFRAHGRRALGTLARVVESAECHRLRVGDLDEAVALVDGLVGR